MDVSVDEGGFADALGAEDDDLGFENVGHCLLGVKVVGLSVVLW